MLSLRVTFSADITLRDVLSKPIIADWIHKVLSKLISELKPFQQNYFIVRHRGNQEQKQYLAKNGAIALRDTMIPFLVLQGFLIEREMPYIALRDQIIAEIAKMNEERDDFEEYSLGSYQNLLQWACRKLRQSLPKIKLELNLCEDNSSQRELIEHNVINWI